jgi:dTDP-4-amino-4,6-dideoxygalactose transaminase
MNPAAAARAITPRTRCLVPVHLYGHPADMSALVDLAARHDLKIVEDCSHAHGAAWQKQHVGTFGQIGCFSCYPTKNLGAFGDAGICVTSDPQLAARLGALRQYGFNEDRVADSDGQNSRLDELQAAILRVRLAHFRETLGHRRSMAGEYLQQLAGTSLVLPCQSPGAVHAFHLFVVRSAQRSRLIERLAANHIDCAVHYPRPLHRMPAFQVFVTAADDLSVTEQAAAEVLSLPLFTGISRREIDRVAKVLLEVARS